MPDAYGDGVRMIPRTLEESFIYENINSVREGNIDVLLKLPENVDFEADYQLVFDKIGKKRFKKVEFALNQIETDFNWNTPIYIKEGLDWLTEKLEL